MARMRRRTSISDPDVRWLWALDHRSMMGSNEILCRVVQTAHRMAVDALAPAPTDVGQRVMSRGVDEASVLRYTRLIPVGRGAPDQG